MRVGYNNVQFKPISQCQKDKFMTNKIDNTIAKRTKIKTPLLLQKTIYETPFQIENNTTITISLISTTKIHKKR